MSGNKGYYSLVQFCPDPSRLEGVNVGVVLYSPADGQLKVHITRDNKRIRRFFGDQDWSFVRRAKNAIENQLKTQRFASVEELGSFIARRANAIQMTPLRSLRITDIECDLVDLHRRLVGQDEDRKLRVNGYLTQKLKEAGVASLVQKSVKVEIPEVQQSIHAPYGYQNGRYNLITPVQFDSDFEKIIEKTGKSAFEGQLVDQHPHPQLGKMRLVVVANFDKMIAASMRNLVERKLSESNVQLYSFENMQPLFDDIRRSAAAHS